MNKELINKILIYSGIIILFLAISYGFVPEVLGGKIVNQSDFSGWKGMTQEITRHNTANPDDKTLWTNSMFGGMPTVSMYDDFDGDWTKPVYKGLLSGARPANYLFISLVGAFLLMLSFGINGIIAVGGAIAVTFCSYNLQIIQVGHNTKMQAIAFMPWVLAALVFTYRSILADGTLKKRLPATLLGASLFALVLSFQIKANHPQITYYLAIIIFIYAIALLIHTCIRDRKRIGRFFIASSLLLVIGSIGIATNLNKLIPTYRYAEYTMRGGSELTPETEHDNDKGLDLDYATAWSYGIEETPNLMIPDFNGGSSSGEMNKEKSETYHLLKQAGQPDLDQVIKSLPLYWGPQPFTAGPMYLGAVSVFLFILGLLLFRGKEKWWLLTATVIAVFLAWGNHFMWFTKLWFEYAPMYNKFRTVSMALVILQITVPLLGFLVLDRIFKESYSKKSLKRSIWTAFGITAGFCLLCVLVPGIAGNFHGAADAGLPEVLTETLAADRKSLLVDDALRSLIFITFAASFILWSFSGKGSFGKDRNGNAVPDGGFQQKGRSGIAAVAFVILICTDLLPVGKRYLDNDDFVSNREFSGQFAQRPVDKAILQDRDLDYRVLDISVNTFNDAHPSFHHRCIGGYSPAKMQRYQDLIEKYLSKEISGIAMAANSAATIQDVSAGLPSLPVTSMLNGKYIIIGRDYPPVVNPQAMGNCWFVDSAVAAHTPDEEIALLGSTDLKTAAIIGDDFKWAQDKIDSLCKDFVTPSDREESATEDMARERDYNIEMTSYKANELRYSCSLASERAVIFSEIYYPEGWKAWIEPAGSYGTVEDGRYRPTPDGKEVRLFRADWILRGAVLPEGGYDLVMRFEPQSYKIGEQLSRASSITLIIILLLSSLAVAAGSGKRRIG